MKVYLDNAATTRVDDEVIEVMFDVLKNAYGNPSSIHAFGRQSKVILEESRNQIANFINAQPGEVFFTAGGTEADNMVIRCAVEELNVNHIITSEIEHHAVLDTSKVVTSMKDVRLSFVEHDDQGYVSIPSLVRLLEEHKDDTILVSLMHANNEIGNLIPLKEVATLCKNHGVYFHSDTVQTMSHYKFDVRDLEIDFLTCSAHKFHGPKGVGFLFVNSAVAFKPMITGGSQERKMRAGTENIHGIVGLAKAMEVAHRDMEHHAEHIMGLKQYMMGQLQEHVPGVRFNGDPKGNSLYTVLNVSFPSSAIDEMFLYNLDIEGVAVSGGSACSSGSNLGSHVLKGIGADMDRPSIRFSFGKYNTKEEIDYTIKLIKELLDVKSVYS